MTQEQFDQRLTAAVVRLGEVMKRADGLGIHPGAVLRDLQYAANAERMPEGRRVLAQAEEGIDILAEALPPEARVLDAPLRDKVVALCFEHPAVADYARENDIGAPINAGMNYDNGDAG